MDYSPILVQCIGYECDLALLEVSDEEFWEVNAPEIISAIIFTLFIHVYCLLFTQGSGTC